VGTLTDLNYQQVLDNVALFTANPDALPALGVFNAGTVTVQDQGSFTASAQYSPTLTFAQQGGGGFILMLLPGLAAQRQVTENWSMVPVTNSDHLRRLRCAFQLLVDAEDGNRCDACREQLQTFFAGETPDLDCVLPRGWYHTGGKKDVPKHACFVGRYCETYVWVTPEGRDGLTRFTLAVLDLATGKPHLPTKTVVKTYKADGTLDHTQETSTHLDREALEKQKQPRKHQPDRERLGEQLPPVNPGLFFAPK